MNAPLSGKPSRIIIADDHEWILQILVQVVRDTLPSAEVIAVEDGEQALAAYHQGGCDFLVTNHRMPRMDGTTLTRQVRAEAPDLSILMVSVKPEVRVEAMEAGANWFLTKEQIMEKLPSLLRRHAASVADSDAKA